MTLPPGIWICLITGAALIGLPRNRRSPGLCLLGGLCTLAGFSTPCWNFPAASESVSDAWWIAAAWWSAFAWAPQIRSSRSQLFPHDLGWSTLTATGLLVSAVADDWVTLFLSIEMVRQGTISRVGSDAVTEWEGWCPLVLTAALVGWLGVTGSVSLEEWRAVLAESYLIRDSSLSLGRPSLVLVGATVLTVFGAAGPVFWSWRAASGPQPTDDLAVRLGAMTARQCVALLTLRQLTAGGIAGLSAVWIVSLSVVALLSWSMTLRWVSDRQRFDRLVLGAAQFPWGALLLWLCVDLCQTRWSDTAGELVTSLEARWVFTAAVIHELLTLATICAAASWLVTSVEGVSFLDQFRGLGSRAPVRTALLLVTFASFVGFPMTAGFWLHCSWLLSLLGIHQIGPDATVLPHPGLRITAVCGVLTLAVVMGAVAHLARLMLFESPLGSESPRTSAWAKVLAVGVPLVVIVLGLAPILLF